MAASRRRYSLILESMMMVTGPSFIRAHCMSAPKTPFWTGRPAISASLAQYFSYRGTARSWPAARMYEGLLPFLVEAVSVNCDTASNAPSTLVTLRFITPFSSSKILIPTVFWASHSISASVSPFSTPTSMKSPFPMLLTTSPPMLTDASLTLCITSLMFIRFLSKFRKLSHLLSFR